MSVLGSTSTGVRVEIESAGSISKLASPRPLSPSALETVEENSPIVLSFSEVEGSERCHVRVYDRTQSAWTYSNAQVLSEVCVDDIGVICWGDDLKGLTSVPDMSNPVSVSVGPDHACALADEGVVCWGGNVHGESTVPLVRNPTEVSVGFNYTCAIDDTGVVCWGRGDRGQLEIPKNND